MFRTECAEHIARECVLPVRADLLAHELDDEGARTLLHACGLFRDKRDFMLHLAHECIGAFLPPEDAPETLDVRILLRDGLGPHRTRGGRRDVGVHAAPLPKCRTP